MAISNRTAFALLFATSIAASVSLPALAAEGRGQHASFEELDLNADGFVTLDELEAAQQTRFDTADTDGDGVLSEAELAVQIQERGAERAERMARRMLQHLDDNNDGVLSSDEAQRRDLNRMINRADTDDDNAISAEEFAEANAGRGGDGKRGGRGGDRSNR